MRELSLNILDITQNSLSAKATLVFIDIEIVTQKDLLRIAIKDNGCGMNKEFLQHVIDPFVTTRKTRKVGLGIPFFKMAAEMTGGRFDISSEVNVGTEIEAVFVLSSIDRMPLGDMAGTITSLIAANPEADFVFRYSIDGNQFEFDTRQAKKLLDGVSIASPDIIMGISDMIKENINELNGGKII